MERCCARRRVRLSVRSPGLPEPNSRSKTRRGFDSGDSGEVAVRQKRPRGADRQVAVAHALRHALEAMQRVERQLEDNRIHEDRDRDPDQHHGHGDGERPALVASCELGPGKGPGQGGQRHEDRACNKYFCEQSDLEKGSQPICWRHGRPR